MNINVVSKGDCWHPTESHPFFIRLFYLCLVDVVSFSLCLGHDTLHRTGRWYNHYLVSVCVNGPVPVSWDGLWKQLQTETTLTSNRWGQTGRTSDDVTGAREPSCVYVFSRMSQRAAAEQASRISWREADVQEQEKQPNTNNLLFIYNAHLPL